MMIKFFCLFCVLFSANVFSEAKEINSSDQENKRLEQKASSDQEKPRIITKSEVKDPKQLPRDYLIEKLEYLHTTLPDKYKGRQALTLRLAHILSLKSEDNFLKAEKEKCGSCKLIAQETARKSLDLYKTLNARLNSRHPLLHSHSLFKQAYLYRFLGEKSQSLTYLNKIVKNPIDPLLVTRAWFNIGEIYFDQYNYTKSLKAFNKVLNRDLSPWTFRANYRKIWSLSNLSMNEQSVELLESFLNSKIYAQKQLSLEDQKIKSKLESELIALYTYGNITDKHVSFLYNFSKINKEKNSLIKRNQRLFDLAQALNRIGRMKYSNKVWYLYLTKNPTLQKRLQAYHIIINNNFILKQANFLEETGAKLEKVFKLQSQVSVSENLLKSLKNQAKTFLDQINRNKKLSPKQKKYLLSLYKHYNSIYPNDWKMLSRSAVLSIDLKQHALAQDLLQEAVLIIISLNKVADKQLKKDKEVMTALQMSMAELTKKETRRLGAYQFYIAYGMNPKLIVQAKYQKTYIAYKNGKYKDVAQEFDQLALYQVKGEKTKKIEDLQLKSAHLSLSALVQLGHQEEKIANRSIIFMDRFPNARKEFVRIRHAALLNKVKELVSNKNLSNKPVVPSADKNILKAWDILQLISLKDATKKEAYTYYFNSLLLAKELLKFQEMDAFFKVLLSKDYLKEEDKIQILSWKLWLAELRFDFKEVLKIVNILKPSEESQEHILRLIRLTELAGIDSLPYYKFFVEKFPNSKKTNSVLISMLEKTPQEKQKDLLKKYVNLFKTESDTLTYLILKIDKGRLDEKFIKPFILLPFMKNSPLVSFFQRKESIESFEKEIAKIEKYSLPKKSSNYKLTQAIKNYHKKINKLTEEAQRFLKIDDWTAQVFIISYWEKELLRFYNSITHLPLPKGLTAVEEKEYKSLLEKQLAPYKSQVTLLQKELRSLWSREFLNDYKKSVKQNTVLHALLQWELEKVILVSDIEIKQELQILLSSLSKNNPNVESVNPEEEKQVEVLYKMLWKNPFDKTSLKKLLELEKTRNNEIMSFYLVNRINYLNENKKWIQL